MAASELLSYLRYRRGWSGGALLRGTSAKNNGGRLTPDSVRSRLKRLCDAADVELLEGSPLHGLRRYPDHSDRPKTLVQDHLLLDTWLSSLRSNPARRGEVAQPIQDTCSGLNRSE